MKRKAMNVNELKAVDLPPALRWLMVNTKGSSKMREALILTALTCYCGLAPRLRVKYRFDFSLSMLLVNLLVIGPSGVGKNLITWLVDLLMKPLIERDKEERRKLREYKEASKRKGANKDKGEEPIVAVRFLQKFSLPVAVKYCDLMNRRYGDWMPFFLFGTELGSFVENKRGNAEFQSVSRTAYTAGEMYSRDTMYMDGYNAIVDINWCSVLTGQERALDKYIDKEGVVLGDAGRQILTWVGEELGEDASELRPLSQEQSEAIRSMVNRLMAETYAEDGTLQPVHEVPMQWLDDDVEAWCEAVRDEVIKTGSNAMNSFYTRASCTAFRLATMLYYLWGEDVTRQRQVRRCYYYYAQMILDNAMAKWGHVYESMLAQSSGCQAKAPSLYEQMPKRFTREDLRQKTVDLKLITEVKFFLSKWKKKRWIYEVEKDVFEKI